MHRLRSWVSMLGLWPRMALTVSATFSALFIAFSLLGERAMRESNERLLQERLVIAQLTANQIDEWLAQERLELVQAHLVSDFDVESPDFLDQAESLKQYFVQLNEFVPGFFFTNKQGHVVYSNPPDLYVHGTDLSEFSYIRMAIDLRKDTISDPFHSPLNNHPVTAVTIPLFVDNKFSGLLTGLLDMQDEGIRKPLIQAAMLGETAHSALSDSQGRALATTFGLPFLVPGEHYSFYERAIAEGKPTVETVPFELDWPDEPEGHKHVMAFAPLQTVNWGVAVGGDAFDTTFAGLRQLRLGLIALAILAFVSSWGITLLSSRQLIRPLQTLTNAAQRIAHGDLHHPLPVLGVAEISQMSTSLERMRLQFLENIEQLEILNATLEEQVALQTKDLRHQKYLTQLLLRRIISAQEEERIRLARELHDEIGQTLTAIEFAMTHLNNLLPGEASPAHVQLEQVRDIAEQARNELHRVVTAMRPGVLDKLGLVAAIGWISNQTLSSADITVSITTQNMNKRLPREIETTLFRIAQEAIQNVAQHSAAQSLKIQLNRYQQHVAMILTDDGKGWISGQGSSDNNKLINQRLGLLGIEERAALVDGEIQINSEPGKGFQLKIRIPLSYQETIM